MLYKYLSPIWRAAPARLRMWAVRRTQTTFTVSAAAVIFNDRGEVLLLDHILRPGGSWGLPGGFLNAEEQPADALRREIMEETGIRIDELRMFNVRTVNRHIEILFTAHGDGDGEVLSREITALGWFPIDRLPRRLPAGQQIVIGRVARGEI